MAEYFLIALAVLVVIVIMMSVKIVSQGYRYTIERFGRFVRVAFPRFCDSARIACRKKQKRAFVEQV